MPRDSQDYRLIYALIIKMLPYLRSSFISIKEWHVTIHQYEIIATELIIVFLNIVFDGLNCLSPVEGYVRYFFCVFHLDRVIHYNESCIDIECLIVNYQYSLFSLSNWTFWFIVLILFVIFFVLDGLLIGGNLLERFRWLIYRVLTLFLFFKVEFLREFRIWIPLED